MSRVDWGGVGAEPGSCPSLLPSVASRSDNSNWFIPNLSWLHISSMCHILSWEGRWHKPNQFQTSRFPKPLLYGQQQLRIMHSAQIVFQQFLLQYALRRSRPKLPRNREINHRSSSCTLKLQVQVFSMKVTVEEWASGLVCQLYTYTLHPSGQFKEEC